VTIGIINGRIWVLSPFSTPNTPKPNKSSSNWPTSKLVSNSIQARVYTCDFCTKIIKL